MFFFAGGDSYDFINETNQLHKLKKCQKQMNLVIWNKGIGHGYNHIPDGTFPQKKKRTCNGARQLHGTQYMKATLCSPSKTAGWPCMTCCYSLAGAGAPSFIHITVVGCSL
jgi:hypothetical protein